MTNADLAAQRLEERVDDLARVPGGQLVLLGRAEVGDAGRLGRVASPGRRRCPTDGP